MTLFFHNKKISLIDFAANIPRECYSRNQSISIMLSVNHENLYVENFINPKNRYEHCVKNKMIGSYANY